MLYYELDTATGRVTKSLREHVLGAIAQDKYAGSDFEGQYVPACEGEAMLQELEEQARRSAGKFVRAVYVNAHRVCGVMYIPPGGMPTDRLRW